MMVLLATVQVQRKISGFFFRGYPSKFLRVPPALGPLKDDELLRISEKTLKKLNNSKRSL